MQIFARHPESIIGKVEKVEDNKREAIKKIVPVLSFDLTKSGFKDASKNEKSSI